MRRYEWDSHSGNLQYVGMQWLGLLVVWDASLGNLVEGCILLTIRKERSFLHDTRQ